ncbi:MAG TPA: ATP-binding cassette domain-containing protein [Myxococcota bacterium]
MTARAPAAAAGPRRVLALRGARIARGGRTVLDRVDWDVHAGETWFVLGPNGAGKTTLLHAVLGLLPLAAGRIERDPEQAALERIGFVPQRGAIRSALPTTVRELVGLGLVGVRQAAREHRERVAEALAATGLSGLEERCVWALSGGQLQRALVARALVRRPSLLILDEPTEGLDPAGEEAFLDLVQALQRARGATVVCATHRLAVVAPRASHLAWVDAGTVTTGPADAMRERPELRRAGEAAAGGGPA